MRPNRALAPIFAALLLVLLVPPPAAAFVDIVQLEPTVTYLEDFESDNVDSEPVGTLQFGDQDTIYTYSSGGCSFGCIVKSDTGLGGNKLFRMDTTTDAGASFDFTPSGVDFCEAGVGLMASVSFPLLGSGAGAMTQLLLWQTSGVNNFVALEGIYSAAPIALRWHTFDGATDNFGNFLTVAYSTASKYSVEFDVTSCEPSVSGTIRVAETQGTVTTIETQTFTHTGDIPGGLQVFGGTQDTSGGVNLVLKIDNIFVTGATRLVPAGGITSVAVSNLVGFDADDFGNFLIARSGSSPGGVTVQTYSGDSSLLPIMDPPVDTDCGTTDRVMASRVGFVAYVICNPGNPADAEELRFRTPTGTSAGVPSYCSGFVDRSTPDFDLDESEWPGAGTPGAGLGEISELIDYPIDCSAGRDRFLDNFRWWALGVSTLTGNVGVMTYMARQGGVDQLHLAQSFFSTAPQQICTNEDDSGTKYIAAVKGARSTLLWTVAFEEDAGTSPDLVPSMTLFGSGFPNSVGIACREQRIALELVSQSQLSIYGVDGTLQTTRTGLEMPISRGVAMSDEVTAADCGGVSGCVPGQWVAIINGDYMEVRSASTLNVVARALAPATGNFLDIEMTRAGQVVYVATSTGITRYDVHSLTTGETVSDVTGSPPSVPPGEGGGGAETPGEQAGREFASFLRSLFGIDIPAAAAAAILGILLMLLAALLGLVVSGGWKRLQVRREPEKYQVMIAGGFALTMFFVNWTLGLFSLAIVLGTLILAIVVFFWARGGRD